MVENSMVISYLTMRKVIGVLGASLAFLCIIGGLLFGAGVVESSISAYYLTNMRDLFVGILFMAGAFLLSCKGYDKMDQALFIIAGITAIGTAIFPTAFVLPGNVFGIMNVTPLHFISAGIFFAVLGFTSLFQFTKFSPDKAPTEQKLKRNVVYRVCGIVIFVALILVAISKIFVFGGPYLVLIAEIIMLLAFAVSWFIKGETLLKDK